MVRVYLNIAIICAGIFLMLPAVEAATKAKTSDDRSKPAAQEPPPAGANPADRPASEPSSGGRVTDSSLHDPITGMEFVKIPGGCFHMGDSVGDGDTDEKPVHDVCVNGFNMGKYEVKVGQFRKFVNDTGYRTDAEKGDGCYIIDSRGNWSKTKSANWKNPGFIQTDNHPAVCLSYNDATAFVRWISRVSGKSYRLPTEAEWEYAARGGTTSINYWGNSKDTTCGHANVADRAAKNQFSAWTTHSCDDGYLFTAPSGSFKPNAFGLYDMMGNAWEWCHDWYGESYYVNAPRNNPQGPLSEKYRVLRGGAWFDGPASVRASTRGWDAPDERIYCFGFRLVLPSQDQRLFF